MCISDWVVPEGAKPYYSSREVKHGREEGSKSTQADEADEQASEEGRQIAVGGYSAAGKV